MVASGIAGPRWLRQRETRYTIIFGRSAITANPPFMSPYSVQYPTDISLLLPVVSSSGPNLLESRLHNGLSHTAPLRRNNELRQSWQNRPQGFPHMSRLHELWRACYRQPQAWQPCLGSERRRQRTLLSSGA